MQTRSPAREPRASSPFRRRAFAPAHPRIPVGVLRVAVGSLFSVALVVALVTAAGTLVRATDPRLAAKPPDGALALLVEAAAGDPDAAGPLDPPAAPSTANRRVSPLLELAFGARRRRRHLPLGAAVDAVVAIAAMATARVLLAVAVCKVGCWCSTCSPSAAGWLASACECA